MSAHGTALVSREIRKKRLREQQSALKGGTMKNGQHCEKQERYEKFESYQRQTDDIDFILLDHLRIKKGIR